VALAGCSAPIYENRGPNPSAEPPRTILVRVVGVEDATEPESVSIDGEALCHNYDPGRRKLPRCPGFDEKAEGNRFVLETYVAVGEHRVSVHGWGNDYVLKVDQLFMPGTTVTCEFDYKEITCTGSAAGDVLAELEALQASPGASSPADEAGSPELPASEPATETPDAPGSDDLVLDDEEEAPESAAEPPR
jgi:hypothetical protein